MILTVLKTGSMSYSSPNMYLGLYKNNKLIDENVYGWFSFELISWKKKNIILKVKSKHPEDYTKNWLNRKENKKIGDFNLLYEF